MKKKLLLLPAVMGLIGCSLSSCNKQVFDFNYKFTRVHVFETGKCYPISSWTDYEGEQIQVDVTGYGKVVFNSNKIALIEHNCPFCD